MGMHQACQRNLCSATATETVIKEIRNSAQIRMGMNRASIYQDQIWKTLQLDCIQSLRCASMEVEASLRSWLHSGAGVWYIHSPHGALGRAQ